MTSSVGETIVITIVSLVETSVPLPVQEHGNRKHVRFGLPQVRAGANRHISHENVPNMQPQPHHKRFNISKETHA